MAEPVTVDDLAARLRAVAGTDEGRLVAALLRWAREQLAAEKEISDRTVVGD